MLIKTVLAVASVGLILLISYFMGSNVSTTKPVVVKTNNTTKRKVWKHYQLGIEKERVSNNRSKGEKECLRAAVKIFDTDFKTVRPNWLKNPKTNRNLEIDLYSDKLGIGIEYQGEQHTRYIKKFHRTKAAYLKQIENDRLKVKLCDKVGVYLIRVYHDCEDIEKFIYDNAPKDCISEKYKPKK